MFLKNGISIEFPYCVYEVTNLTFLGKLTRTRTLKKVQTIFGLKYCNCFEVYEYDNLFTQKKKKNDNSLIYCQVSKTEILLQKKILKFRFPLMQKLAGGHRYWTFMAQEFCRTKNC